MSRNPQGEPRPLTDAEEREWRGWLAAGHMPFGNDDIQGERIARLFATLDVARAETAAPVEALREALTRALPRAINFRFLPPRSVNDPIWREVANDLAAALRAIESPAHPETGLDLRAERFRAINMALEFARNEIDGVDPGKWQRTRRVLGEARNVLSGEILPARVYDALVAEDRAARPQDAP